MATRKIKSQQFGPGDDEAKAVLEKLRGLTERKADVTETPSFGHPNFKVAGRVFAAFEKYKGEWCIAFVAHPTERETLLEDPLFYVTPYSGKRGWVSYKVVEGFSWKKAKGLVETSYALIKSNT